MNERSRFGRLTELGRVDVCELRSVTIPTTSQLLLIIVIITRSQSGCQLVQERERDRICNLQITEDQLGNHYSLFLVHLDWDTLSVVHD